MQIKAWAQYFLKWTVISCLVGVLGGTASAFFLISLELATRFRDQHTWLIWFLPVGGLLMGLIYHRWGKSVEAGNNLIIDEIHNPRALIPLRMAPLILLGTVMTHIFGGSAGREGTAVQMGAAAADQLAKPLRLNKEERRTLLMAGMSAGFGSVFGVPLAGMAFGLEVLTVGRLKLGSAFECLLASVVAHFTCLAWGVRHTAYFAPTVVPVSIQSVFWVALAGIAFGLCAQVFAKVIHQASRVFKNAIAYVPLRPFVGGILVLLGFWMLGTFRYAGLGIPVIEQALREPLSAFDFIWKMLFTIVTLGSGFKGGEVTPLLFIGSTLGNSLSALIPLPFSMLAAVGFVAVFAGAANTPWACTIMAIEIFGSPIAIYALIGCLMSYFASGHVGIYHAQEFATHKLHSFGKFWRYLKCVKKPRRP